MESPFKDQLKSQAEMVLKRGRSLFRRSLTIHGIYGPKHNQTDSAAFNIPSHKIYAAIKTITVTNISNNARVMSLCHDIAVCTPSFKW